MKRDAFDALELIRLKAKLRDMGACPMDTLRDIEELATRALEEGCDEGHINPRWPYPVVRLDGT